MSFFESLTILPPKGIEIGRMENLNSDLKDTDCPANSLSVASVWDNFYKVTILIMSADPGFSFDKILLGNKARLFLKQLFEDDDPLFKCQSCGKLYYEEEVKSAVRKSWWKREKIVSHSCTQIGCMGNCNKVEE